MSLSWMFLEWYWLDYFVTVHITGGGRKDCAVNFETSNGRETYKFQCWNSCNNSDER